MTKPVLQIVKGLFIGDIKHDDECMCSTVVACSDCMKTLLACCIPNLYFKFMVMNVGNFGFEIYSDGGDVILLKNIVNKPGNKSGFSDTCISNQ